MALAALSIQQASAPSYRAVDAIFQDKCIVCHNHTNRASGLNLESIEALMNGGKRGVPVVPGKSGESLLIKFLDGSAKPQMPLGDKLSADEIKIVKDWIDRGAIKAEENEGGKIREKISNASLKVPEIKPAVPVKAAISSLAVNRDGSLIALGEYREIELLGAGKISKKYSGLTNQVRAIAFSPDGKLLAAAGGSPSQFGEVKIFSVEDGHEILSIRGHRDNIFSLAFSPDGKTIATCSYDKMIKLWEVSTGQEIRNLKDHTDAVFAVAFSPDGKRLASASADRTVKIWDVASGTRLYTMSDSLDAVNSIAFHPSGKFLAASGADRIIHIWELGEKEATPIRSLIAHEDVINQIAYSPDGKILASTGADKLIKLWDATNLNELKTLEPQSDWVMTMTFTPDGKNLIVGRFDGTAEIYEITTGKGTKLK